MPDLSPSIAALATEASRLETLLVEWANENSGSHHHSGLLRMAARLESAFGALPEVRTQRIALPNTPVPAMLFSFRPEISRRVLCSGHFDTVYGEDHAFQHCAALPNGLLGGPGVADMKGGLIVMLAALSAFGKLPAAERLGWDVLLTPDEEIGSPHSNAVLLEQARGHIAALVFEPARANGDLVRSRMGTGVLTATCRGRAAHAAQQPNHGRNAIVALAEFLMAADALPRQIPGTLLNIGTVHGGGTVNVVPDLACADINIRASTTAAAERLSARLAQLAADISAREGFSLALTGGFERPPKECMPAEEKLFAAYIEGFAKLKLPPPGWQDVGGGSDGNLFSAAGLPNLDGLGIVGRNLHSVDEYCHPDSIVPRAQAAALLMEFIAT